MTTMTPAWVMMFLCLISICLAGREEKFLSDKIGNAAKRGSADPDIVNFQRVYDASVGGTVKLTCDVKSGSYNPAIVWYKKNYRGRLRDQPNVTETDSLRQFDGTYRRVVTIKNIQRSAAGEYICHTQNSNGNAMASTEIKITGSPEQKPANDPKIVHFRKVYDVEVGGTVRLTCDVRSSSHNPYIMWYKKNYRGRLRDQPNVTETDSLRQFDGTYRRVVTIKNIQRSAAGEYICHTQNSKGNAMASTEIKISSPKQKRADDPKIVHFRKVYDVEVGGTVRLTCDVRSSSHNPYILWSMHNKNFRGRLRDLPNVTETESLRQFDGTYRRVLTMRNVQRSAAGVYVCHTQNSKGNAQAFTEIKIISQEPTR